jgi:hypothetical protein
VLRQALPQIQLQLPRLHQQPQMMTWSFKKKSPAV